MVSVDSYCPEFVGQVQQTRGVWRVLPYVMMRRTRVYEAANQSTAVADGCITAAASDCHSATDFKPN